MKTLITIILLSSFALSQEAVIKEIKRNYAIVKGSQSQYKKSNKNINDLSSEGAVATVYRDSANNVKIVTADYYGETGKTHEEYYFNNDSIFFSYSEEQRYNAPMYFDSTAAHNDGGEAYDPKKTKIEVQRFYLTANKLVQCLNPQMLPVAKDKEYYEKEKDILELSRLLLK